MIWRLVAFAPHGDTDRCMQGRKLFSFVASVPKGDKGLTTINGVGQSEGGKRQNIDGKAEK